MKNTNTQDGITRGGITQEEFEQICSGTVPDIGYAVIDSVAAEPIVDPDSGRNHEPSTAAYQAISRVTEIRTQTIYPIGSTPDNRRLGENLDSKYLSDLLGRPDFSEYYLAVAKDAVKGRSWSDYHLTLTRDGDTRAWVWLKSSNGTRPLGCAVNLDPIKALRQAYLNVLNEPKNERFREL